MFKMDQLNKDLILYLSDFLGLYNWSGGYGWFNGYRKVYQLALVNKRFYKYFEKLREEDRPVCKFPFRTNICQKTCQKNKFWTKSCHLHFNKCRWQFQNKKVCKKKFIKYDGHGYSFSSDQLCEKHENLKRKLERKENNMRFDKLFHELVRKHGDLRIEASYDGGDDIWLIKDYQNEIVWESWPRDWDHSIWSVMVGMSS